MNTHDFTSGPRKHLDYPEASMFNMVERIAKEYPYEPAWDLYGKKENYQAFVQSIEETARGLTALGIHISDTVTICLPNIPQALYALYAVDRLGATASMLHPLSAEDEILYALKLTSSKLIVTVDMFYDKVRRAADRFDPNVRVIVVRIQEELPLAYKTAYILRAGWKYLTRPAGMDLIWHAMIKRGRGVSVPKVPYDPDRTACILFSGGTSGKSKGVRLTDFNINACALQTREILQVNFRPGLTMLSCMPIFHGFGLAINLHTVLIHGACCILMPTFNGKTYANMLLKKKPSFIAGVPAIFEALLANPALQDADLSFLLGVFCGGDSLPVTLKEKVDAFLKARGAQIQIREGYGLTECVTASCLTPRDSWRPGSIGLPFPDTVYDIVVPGTTKSCAPGEKGEIVLKGPSVMQGYLRDPEETEKALRKREDGDIWLYTGDMGYMDADGYVYFVQRIKRLIVTNGYNVYPSQLEKALDNCPLVEYSCVLGIPDPRRGQIVKAFIVPAKGVDASDETRERILEHLKQSVASYALPRRIEFRKELPRTLVGKVAYHKLEEEELVS